MRRLQKMVRPSGSTIQIPIGRASRIPQQASSLKFIAILTEEAGYT